MRPGLVDDLDAFGRGEKSRDEIEAVHGGSVAPLIDVVDRLRAAAALPTTTDVGDGWRAVARRIEAGRLALVPGGEGDVLPTAGVRPRRRGRRVILVAAACLLIGGSAFASTGGFGMLRPGPPPDRPPVFEPDTADGPVVERDREPIPDLEPADSGPSDADSDGGVGDRGGVHPAGGGSGDGTDEDSDGDETSEEDRDDDEDPPDVGEDDQDGSGGGQDPGDAADGEDDGEDDSG